MKAQGGQTEVWEELRKLTRAHNQCVRTLQAEIRELQQQVAELEKALAEAKALAVAA